DSEGRRRSGPRTSESALGIRRQPSPDHAVAYVPEHDRSRSGGHLRISERHSVRRGRAPRASEPLPLTAPAPGPVYGLHGSNPEGCIGSVQRFSPNSIMADTPPALM